jgi:hypothetical protein
LRFLEIVLLIQSYWGFSSFEKFTVLQFIMLLGCNSGFIIIIIIFSNNSLWKKFVFVLKSGLINMFFIVACHEKIVEIFVQALKKL